MTNPFIDQETFMRACGQSSLGYNEDQFTMYLKLINEELQELNAALQENNKVEMLDALTDILVVTIGAMQSAGFDAEGAWNEVMRTNFAKVDSKTGMVNKREDGKVLKPNGWKPPNLASFVEK